MKRRFVKLDSANERIPIIVDNDGLPIDRLNEYVLHELRGGADGTTEIEVTKLLHIEKWASALGLNLADEMATDCLADKVKFKSLIKHLQMYTEQARTVTAFKSKMVQPDYFDSRLESCIRYFTFLHEKAIARRYLQAERTVELERAFGRLTRKLEKRKLRDKAESTKSGLSPYQQASLFHGLENSAFGFKKTTALRNSVIIHLFYETGIRASELLSLTIPNCHTRPRVPYIVVAQNTEHLDPRKKVPHIKTVRRTLLISNKLAKMIDEYKVLRSKPIEARKQPPYLILASTKPYAPLTQSSLNGLFNRVKNYLSGVDSFHPHMLRHTFFENLDTLFSRNNMERAQQDRIKNSLGGWSRKSRQHESYEKNSTALQANEALDAMHRMIEEDHRSMLLDEGLPWE